jgi:hypothetical protein
MSVRYFDGIGGIKILNVLTQIDVVYKFEEGRNQTTETAKTGTYMLHIYIPLFLSTVPPSRRNLTILGHDVPKQPEKGHARDATLLRRTLNC